MNKALKDRVPLLIQRRDDGEDVRHESAAGFRVDPEALLAPQDSPAIQSDVT